MASPHRKIIATRYKPRWSNGGRLTSRTTTPQDHDLRRVARVEKHYIGIVGSARLVTFATS